MQLGNASHKADNLHTLLFQWMKFQQDWDARARWTRCWLREDEN